MYSPTGFRQRISRMFIQSVKMDTRALEFSIALQCVFFGGWLMLPLTTFSSSTAFGVMAGLAPEGVWGAVFLVVGILDMYLLHRNSISYRKIVMAITLALWLTVDISVFVAGTTSTAGAVFLVTALSSAWCVISISVDRAR